MASSAPIWGTGTWGDFKWKTWGGTAAVATATADSTVPSFNVNYVFGASAGTATANDTTPSYTFALTIGATAASATADSLSHACVGTVTNDALVATVSADFGSAGSFTAVALPNALAAAANDAADDFARIWRVEIGVAEASGEVMPIVSLVSPGTAPFTADAAWNNVTTKFYTIICLPFQAIAPQSLQRGYNGTGWDTNYTNTVQGAPVSLTGWTNPRRSSVDSPEINEVFDSLERYLAGTVYADNLAMAGHTVELKWDAGTSKMRLLVDGVDQGSVELKK